MPVGTWSVYERVWMLAASDRVLWSVPPKATTVIYRERDYVKV